MPNASFKAAASAKRLQIPFSIHSDAPADFASRG